MSTGSLILASVMWPGLLLLGCLSPRLRTKLAAWLWCGPVPALATALFGTTGSSIQVTGIPHHVTLGLDRPGSILLLATSLLWIAAGIYANHYFRSKPMPGSFVTCWVLTMLGSLGIFLATDLVGFLVFYALVSLPAYGLIVSEGTGYARRAGAVYMGFALLGENLLLLAFVLLARQIPDGGMLISEAVLALTTNPGQPLVLTLLILGFGMKMALLPLHFWMPPGYTAAPIPAAAVLSGAAVKAGVIGMLRFLPFESPLPGWGLLLVCVGLAGAFFGVAVGITQRDPKSILGYSSVSQMGFLASLLGMGLAGGDSSVVLIAAFYAAHHVLVKGALFLAVGVSRECGSRNLSLVRWPALAIGLGLAGLPLTGGALAKLAAKAPMGYGWAANLATLSAAGTALLMLHFVQKALTSHHSDAHRTAPLGLTLPWLGTAVLCVVLPWAMFSWSGLDSPWAAFAPAALWKTLWPILLGTALFLVLKSRKVPSVPCGDILELGDMVKPVASGLSATVAFWDRLLKRWGPACVALAAIVVFLTVAMLRTLN